MSGAPAEPVRRAISPAETAVGGALDTMRTKRLLYMPPLLLGFIMLFDSWDSIAIAYVMPSLVAEWGLNPVSMGSLMSAGYAGQFVGAIMLGVFAERYGRMPVFMVSMTIMSLLAIGCAVAPDYNTLFVLRFLQGIMIGGALPVSITYINELAPSHIRGRYFGTFQYICMAGYAAASQSSRFIIPELGWRWLFAAGAIPLLLLPLAAILLPESPRWLARAGRIKDANRALARLGGPTETISGDDVVSVAPTPAAPLPPAERTRMTDLFSREFRKRTWILIALWFFTSFTNFGLTTWVPSIYATVFKFPVAEALSYSAIGSTVFLILAPITAAIMDHTGRRPLGLGGVAIATIGLIALTINPPDERWLLVTMVVAGHMGTSIGVLVLWPYTAENYPTRVRALGVGTASSIARGASMLTPLAVGGILSGGGSITIVFAVFALCAGIATVLWITSTRETARRSLDEL